MQKKHKASIRMSHSFIINSNQSFRYHWRNLSSLVLIGPTFMIKRSKQTPTVWLQHFISTFILCSFYTLINLLSDNIFMEIILIFAINYCMLYASFIICKTKNMAWLIFMWIHKFSCIKGKHHYMIHEMAWSF